jgi:hypothetical protein
MSMQRIKTFGFGYNDGCKGNKTRHNARILPNMELSEIVINLKFTCFSAHHLVSAYGQSGGEV